MELDRTTLSGGGLTLITTHGGQPVGRRTVETWFEARGLTPPQNGAVSGGPRPGSDATA